ncbi:MULTISPECIES: DMT family transporter [Shouchella]|uniref:DMT family transporter n=2 Tax=Shouchella TaxID=2893057 RepID=A0ABY7WGQ0_9BACI|nr:MULTISPECIES: DMT family transporter [Shouchella]MED4128799.1 DMT family transporter [Shouchella miscanthi]WDF05820.1 DMT family transporter [Shouchella hunanensis]
MSSRYIYGATIIGAACWGLIGLFIAPLYEVGFTPWDVVTIRVVCTFVLLIGIMFVFYREQLKAQWKDHFFFASAGIISIVFFNYFYFEVFSESSLSVAVTLLYTGPVFVTLLSRLFFKERLTFRKIMALGMAVLGCAFVVGFFPVGQQEVSLYIVGFGLLSGFFYALYSILTKPVTKKYSVMTITTYVFFYASVFMVLSSNTTQKWHLFLSAEVLISAFLLASISTVAGYIFYTIGLKHLEASRASILATVEPLVAVVTGMILLGEVLTLWQIVGILFVLYAAVLVVERKSKTVYVNNE